MRLFIGVNINERSKKFIERKMNILKKDYNNNFKWVKKDNWHLTLKFIGEATAAEKENLIKSLKNIDFDHQKAYINFNRIKAFPNLKKAKVLYLALAQGREVLKKLHQDLEEELSNYNFESDKRDFIPHLTLARSKDNGLEIKDKFKAKNFVNIYARIDSISLYKSELKAGGPEYIELFSIK